MKAFILGTLLAFAILASLTTAQILQSCQCSSECPPGFCCLDPTVRRGKRQASGFCRPRVANGEKCFVDNEQFLPSFGNTLFLDACPCQDGVPCAGTNQFEVPQGEVGKCTEEPKETACSSQKQCADDECCVALNQPIGRKKRALSLSGGLIGGVCKKRGMAGDSCLVSVKVASDLNFACPCMSGLSCEGIGLFEVPLGERGKCTEEPKETTCSSQKQCADDECCVALNQPIGRKKRALSLSGGLIGGVCRKRGMAGDSCLVSFQVPSALNYACPCMPGLSCQGLGFFEVPLGERGSCSTKVKG